MSNFVQAMIKGRAGLNKGKTTGLPALDRAINGIQKSMSIGLAAAQKCGKTTAADFCFVLCPYLEAEAEGTLDDINWIYHSFEIGRVSKEFKYAAFFMAYDYGVYNFTYKGEVYEMNADYLQCKQLHRLPDGTSELIMITEEHSDLLREIYIKRIVPIFGHYDENGIKLTTGKIDFIEEPDNPTGMYKYLFHYAKKNGTFIEESYQTIDETGATVERKRITGYRENNPRLFTIIITDHLRKLRKERGFTMKENMDKWLEYTTWFRNKCQFTPLNICHSNRGIVNVDRLKFAGEFIFPTADDVKDTGNLGEESTIMLTMFNPNDEKYNLKKHFGITLESFPNYRSIHLTDSRNTPCPAHIQVNMYGGVNMFDKLTP